MRISDWSSDVCSSDLACPAGGGREASRGCLLPFQRSLLPLVHKAHGEDPEEDHHRPEADHADVAQGHRPGEQEGDLQVEDDEQDGDQVERSEEHTSELQSLMRISYAVFCLIKKKE